MVAGNFVRRIVLQWKKSKKMGHRIGFSTMTHRSLNDNVNKHGAPILMSPTLVSLDLPDVWDSHSAHFHFPSSSSSPNIYTNEGTAAVINGQLIAEEIRSGIAGEVRRMKESIGEVPGLAVIVVGQRRDSQTYVRNKVIACEEVGIVSEVAEFHDDCAEEEVLDALASFNSDPSVHGILVQLPLPQHVDVGKITDMLRLEKDVDGFHPINIGNLAMRGREPLFIPCTPKGCIELLIRSGIEMVGKKAVVIGRSNIVGLPTSLLLQRHHATVSIVHALTENPEQITREADIVITAAGMPGIVRRHWLKPGAVVLDVGTNPIEDLSNEHGYHLKGDVCFKEAVTVASAITPVPGGVGPMTIAMLLSNTLDAAKRALNFT